MRYGAATDCALGLADGAVSIFTLSPLRQILTFAAHKEAVRAARECAACVQAVAASVHRHAPWA
jgi:hypothetical protein